MTGTTDQTKTEARRTEYAAWCEANADLVAYLADRAGDSGFHGDLHERITSGRILTERQEAAVRQGMEREALAATAEPVPTGRVTITGRVTEVTDRVERHGYREVWVPKMTVVTDQGWHIKMTVPRAAWDHCLGPDNDSPCQDKISLTVTIKPSKEPMLGFGSRPTKFTILDNED